MSDLNKTIAELNNKLSELEQALSVSLNDAEVKDTEIENLNQNLDIALKEKIGELI